MSNPFERQNNPAKEAEQQKREKFNEVPEAEQVERYMRLADLFKQDSVFNDFFENAYKYPDRVPVEGKSAQEVHEILNYMRNGALFINAVLDFFLQIKKREAQTKNAFEQSKSNLKSSFGRGSFTEKNFGKIKSRELLDAFRFSLEAFVRYGESLGRRPDIQENEINSYLEDFDYILEVVNRYR